MAQKGGPSPGSFIMRELASTGQRKPMTPTPKATELQALLERVEAWRCPEAVEAHDIATGMLLAECAAILRAMIATQGEKT